MFAENLLPAARERLATIGAIMRLLLTASIRRRQSMAC